MKKIANTIKCIFVLYCIVLVWIILFKTAFSWEGVRHLGGVRHINLLPFCNDMGIRRWYSREIAMNVLAFLPFGFYLTMLDVPVIKTILYGCGFSLLLEACQFVFAIGVSDITDVITNTLGTLVGVCLYGLLRLFFRKKQTLDTIVLWSSSAILLFLLALILLTIFTNQ